MGSNMDNTELKPDVGHIAHHYDKSNEFFKLWLDPTMTYSCAYWEDGATTLEEAQTAKLDLGLGKLDLQPGMRLLDMGCGWGSAMRRAVEKYDANVVGLTLSENQYAYNQQRFAELDSPRSKEVRLRGWEYWNEPVDRIVSFGAFEHFADGGGGFDRYDDFFKICYNSLPDDGTGKMLLHTIVVPSAEDATHLPRNMTLLRFIKFILTEIFPGGRLPMISTVDDHAIPAGFEITRHHQIGKNYVNTLDSWAKNLQAVEDKAVELMGRETVDIYMHYLTGCSDLFRDGYTDVCQFTMEKPAS
jgi:cyclopropane-fatty-acyl-phospholipid synthase